MTVEVERRSGPGSSPRYVREAVRLSGPILLSNLCWSALALSDAAFVGHVSGDALTGVAMASTAFEISLGFSMGFFHAIATIIARATTSRDAALGRQYLGAALALIVPLTLLVFGLAAIGALAFPRVSTSPATVDAANTYLVIRLLGVPVALLAATYRGVRYGQSDTVFPTVVMIVSTVLNIPLDYVFVYTLDLGAAGAAWSSNLALAATALAYAWRERRVGIVPTRPTRADVRYLLALGLPSGLKELSGKIGWVVVTTAVALRGDRELGAHFVASNITASLLSCAYSLKSGVQVVAARMVARNDLAAVQPFAMRTGLLSLACAAVLFAPAVLFPAGTARVFGGNDPELVGLVATLLLVGSVGAMSEAAYRPLEGVLAGTGDVTAQGVFTTIMNLTYTPLAAFGGAYLLPDNPLAGVWWGIATIHLCALGYMAQRTFRGRWRGPARASLRQMRQQPRHAVQIAANLRGLVESPPGTLVDVSRGGACLEGIGAVPPVGTDVELMIDGSVLAATIIWADERHGGRVGLCWRDQAEVGARDRLLARAQAGATP